VNGTDETRIGRKPKDRTKKARLEAANEISASTGAMVDTTKIPFQVTSEFQNPFELPDTPPTAPGFLTGGDLTAKILNYLQELARRLEINIEVDLKSLLDKKLEFITVIIGIVREFMQRIQDIDVEKFTRELTEATEGAAAAAGSKVQEAEAAARQKIEKYTKELIEIEKYLVDYFKLSAREGKEFIDAKMEKVQTGSELLTLKGQEAVARIAKGFVDGNAVAWRATRASFDLVTDFTSIMKSSVVGPAKHLKKSVSAGLKEIKQLGDQISTKFVWFADLKSALKEFVKKSTALKEFVQKSTAEPFPSEAVQGLDDKDDKKSYNYGITLLNFLYDPEGESKYPSLTNEFEAFLSKGTLLKLRVAFKLMQNLAAVAT
jgi:hypothetical protein